MGVKDVLKALMNTGSQCIFCGREIAEGSVKCVDCKNAEEEAFPRDNRYGGILHAYKYEGVVRRLVHSLKYDDMPRLSFYAAEVMYDTLKKTKVQGIDMVTFVPVHEKRKRQRGYDQSELIAADLSVLLGVPFVTLFKRIKDTKPQFDLNAHERRENMDGAFETDNSIETEGKTVLLVDDIYTTGSTIEACVKQVKNGTRVIPFVLCREYLE